MRPEVIYIVAAKSGVSSTRTSAKFVVEKFISTRDKPFERDDNSRFRADFRQTIKRITHFPLKNGILTEIYVTTEMVQVN